VWSQLAADCERRKDPEAYKAWKEANAKSPAELFRSLAGGAAGAPAGADHNCDGGSSADADSDEGGNTMPQACRQQ
jgi:hypothetical protein